MINIDDMLRDEIYNKSDFPQWERTHFPGHARTSLDPIKDQELCCTITAVVMKNNLDDINLIKEKLSELPFIEEISVELMVRKLKYKV